MGLRVVKLILGPAIQAYLHVASMSPPDISNLARISLPIVSIVVHVLVKPV